MKPVSAIYENGVFRPTDPVDLPERCRVEIEFHVHSESEEAKNSSPEPAVAPFTNGHQFDPSAPTIEDVVAKIMASVPTEAWASMPDDLTDDLDHYLYGTPRQ